MKRLMQIVILLNCYIAILFPRPAYAQLIPEDWNTLQGKIGTICVMNFNIRNDSVDVATIQGIECLFVNITRILVPVAGLALFIMLIVGAFQFITAGGEPKALQKARSTITYAIFGLVAFFGIWFILLLIKAITGVDVTIFKIPGPN